MITTVDRVITILQEISNKVSTRYEKMALIRMSSLLTSLKKCYYCNNESSSNIIAFLLKLCLEIMFQLKYFKDKYDKDLEDNFIRELSKRSRKGSSFSIRMLTESKGIPGKYKKDFLKIYLKICSYVHPSYEFLLSEQQKINVDNLLLEFLDVLLYVLLTCYGPEGRTCDICREHGLKHCLRKCSRAIS